MPLLVFAVGPVSAQTLDSSSLEALTAALRILQDPSQRNAAIARDPRATSIDTQVRAMAGADPKVIEEFYALAAQVLDEVARSAGGEVDRMSEILARGQSNPAALASQLSPSTLARLRELSTKMAAPRR